MCNHKSDEGLTEQKQVFEKKVFIASSDYSVEKFIFEWKILFLLFLKLSLKFFFRDGQYLV